MLKAGEWENKAVFRNAVYEGSVVWRQRKQIIRAVTGSHCQGVELRDSQNSHIWLNQILAEERVIIHVNQQVVQHCPLLFMFYYLWMTALTSAYSVGVCLSVVKDFSNMLQKKKEFWQFPLICLFQTPHNTPLPLYSSTPELEHCTQLYCLHNLNASLLEEQWASINK